MSSINPIPNDRVRYRLSHPGYDTITITEPEGWDTDEKELARNETYHGIFAKFSNSLKFKGDSLDFIELIYDAEGINATPRLTKEERHPQTDVWTRSYEGYLDMSTRELQDHTLSIKFNSGGLEQILKARESENLELERTESIDGKDIGPLHTDTVALDGRRILLNSKWRVKDTDNTATTETESAGNVRDHTVGVPMNLFSKSHEEAQSIIPETNADDNHGANGIMFMAVVDRQRTYRVKLDITFTTNVTRYAHVNNGWFVLAFGIYGNGTEFDIVDRIELFRKVTGTVSGNHLPELGGIGFAYQPNPLPPQTFTVTYDDYITLEAGQSLSLEFWNHADLGTGGAFQQTGHFKVIVQGIDARLTVTEDSFYEKSSSKFVLMYDAGERLTEIITGRKGNFRSEFFGRTEKGYAQDGPGALTGITHGFWVRGFDNVSVDAVAPWTPGNYQSHTGVTYYGTVYVLKSSVPVPFFSTDFDAERAAGKWVSPPPSMETFFNQVAFDLGDITGLAPGGDFVAYINTNGATYDLTPTGKLYFFRFVMDGSQRAFFFDQSLGGNHVFGFGETAMSIDYLQETFDADFEPNPFKPLTTSFKDFEQSAAAIWNTGLGIERVGFSEKIVMEDLKYFYNTTVTVRLPNQISKAKRTVYTKGFFSSVEVGYEKGGNYEEAMGLDEYNGKSTFTTAINRLVSLFTSISKYRADSYGKEFARRKPKSTYPTEDTQYDEDIFVMDLKRGPIPGVFRERLWQDDFEQAPTGTYSPETATNLRFSPVNNLMRQGWVIAAGLTKYPTDYIRYGSSSANSRLRTKIIGKPERAEDGNIMNGELPRARFVPELLEFEHLCDFGVMQQVEGRTNVNGKYIQNVYGLIEFTNERGQKEKGWLMNLKPNGNGKFQVLTYNSKP